MHDLRLLIRSIIQEDARARELVGDYLWPGGRRRDPYDRSNKTENPMEPDTEREAELREKLIQFIMNHRDGTLDQAAADDLLTIASDPSYKDTLPLLKRGSVYRGVSVSSGWFERNFGARYDDLLAQNPKKARTDGTRDGEAYGVIHTFQRNIAIKSTTPAASWTKDISVAKDFAVGGGKSGSEYSVPLVYEARSRDNSMIDLNQAVYTLSGEDLYGRYFEQEVIAIRAVNVSKVHVLAWSYRTSELPRDFFYKRVGTGYDDVGAPEPKSDKVRRIQPSELDPRFDARNFPDID